MPSTTKTSSFVKDGVQPDPDASLLDIERGPDKRGVGRWVPNEKHRLLAEYLHASRYAWKKWRHRVFIDPFCGPGRVQVEGESFTRDGGALVAWRESVAGGMAFTRMFVGDKDPGRANACMQRLQALGAPVTCFVGEAETTVKAMVDAVPFGALCMVYVDPYSLQLLSLEMLRTLSKLQNVDIAVNFCTMDLSRNVELEFDRLRFDETAPGWQDHMPAKEHSKSNLPRLFFDYWREQIVGLGFKFSKEMPLVFNKQGAPIYRMVFFARHDLPNRIWADVGKSPNHSLDF